MERRKNRWRRKMKWKEGDIVDIKDANPEDIQDFSSAMVMIGSDVSALYPNLDADQVAEIVYMEVKRSDIKCENIDYLGSANSN